MNSDPGNAQEDLAQNQEAVSGHEFVITNKDVIRVHWKVLTLMAAALLFLVTYAINGIINSPHKRIDGLVETVHGISGRIETAEDNIMQLRFDMNNCHKSVLEGGIERQEIENSIKDNAMVVRSHILNTNGDMEVLKYKINNCMDKVGIVRNGINH